jgi:DNA helicase HerA-like ATPase
LFVPALGIVLSATYDTFKFRSALRVLSDSFVVTPLNGNAFLFGRVTGAKTESPNNIIYEVSVLRRGETGGSEVTFFAPRETAVPGAEVYEPSPEVVARALGFDADPAKSLHVGRAGDVDVCLRPDVLPRHIFVGGTTGSGKSYFASVLMEELAGLQVPAVAMDSQADYLEHVKALGGAVVRPGVDYTVPLSSLTTEEAVQMVAALEGTPGYDLFAFSFAALQKEIDMGRRKTFTLTDLLKQMEQDGMHALRLTGYEFRVAMSRVEASIRRHRFLGTMGRNLDWAALLKSGKPVAVDCSSLDLLQLQLVVGATLRELQRLRLAGKIPQFVVFLDEAHLLVPFDSETPCKQVIRECVRIGRHYGMCTVLITQNPLDIDRKIISQCNTRAIFAIEPDQLEALHGIRADATPAMLRGIPKFPRGTCLLSGTYETVRHAVVVRVRELRTSRRS